MFSERPPAEPTHVELKQFEQRRAGIREADPQADKKVLAWKEHARQQRSRSLVTQLVETQVDRALRNIGKDAL